MAVGAAGIADPTKPLAKSATPEGSREIMVIAYATKLRDEGHAVEFVVDDRGVALAEQFGFVPIRTSRILAIAASTGLLTYAETKALYERLRPSNGAGVVDTGLPHWVNSGLNERALYAKK